MLKQIEPVKTKLAWMREEGIWPNGLRYLWTDAFGLVLLVSLYNELGDESYLEEAERLVEEVDRVLGRPKGLRIGEAPERDGQYYHYLAMWLYALHRLGQVKPEYRDRGISLAREIHPHFVRPEVGVIWKMKEDLSGPYPGSGLGGLDPFQGYVVYRLLEPEELSDEIEQLRDLVERYAPETEITQDLGLGMMLWMTHFCPEETWAVQQRDRSLEMLDDMWVDPPGYFARHPAMQEVKFAFTNYGVSVGLQAVGADLDRVRQLNDYFEGYRSGDRYDREAITHVMSCSSRFPGELIRAPAF